MKTLLRLVLFTAALLPARAASPEYINYQGLLNGSNGQPLPTGTYPMEFNIYDQATSGVKQWGPFLFDGGAGNGHGPLVPVANGRFNVIIGPKDTTAAGIQNAFSSSNRFVEIKVSNGSPILPRQQFLSTPYAFKASFADQAATVADPNVAYRNTTNTFNGDQTVNGAATVNGNAIVTGSLTATGNVGIGTNAPTAKLQVVGDIKLGPFGTNTYYATSGEENLRIVRGRVNQDGSRFNGAGFGSSAVAVPASPNWYLLYTITFSPPFTGEPTVTANACTGTGGNHLSFATVTEVSANSCKIIMNDDGDGPLQAPFSFIAIGPR